MRYPMLSDCWFSITPVIRYHGIEGQPLCDGKEKSSSVFDVVPIVSRFWVCDEWALKHKQKELSNLPPGLQTIQERCRRARRIGILHTVWEDSVEDAIGVSVLHGSCWTRTWLACFLSVKLAQFSFTVGSNWYFCERSNRYFLLLFRSPQYPSVDSCEFVRIVRARVFVLGRSWTPGKVLSNSCSKVPYLVNKVPPCDERLISFRC